MLNRPTTSPFPPLLLFDVPPLKEFLLWNSATEPTCYVRPYAYCNSTRPSSTHERRPGLESMLHVPKLDQRLISSIRAFPLMTQYDDFGLKPRKWFLFLFFPALFY